MKRTTLRAAIRSLGLVAALVAVATIACSPGAGPAEVVEQASPAAQDPLPSWNDSAPKQAIIEFVTAVTTEGGADFVAAAERIATFDNDGTLWVEQPMYTQFIFALDRIRELAPEHPEWQTTEPFKSLLEGNMEGVVASGAEGITQILLAGQAGMTTEEFEDIVVSWLATARDERFNRPYNELLYQPMLELLAYLQANDFKTYIVSGGGVEFMRPWTDEAYNIPPEHVIGSSVETRFEMQDGTPVIVRDPEIFFIDDKAGKPVAIQKFIGRRPIASFGNSDGDLEMLQWTLAGDGRRLAMFVHHTDATREYAYDREGHVGTLVRGLDEAATGGWQLIDMAADWNRVFSFDQ